MALTRLCRVAVVLLFGVAAAAQTSPELASHVPLGEAASQVSFPPSAQDSASSPALTAHTKPIVMNVDLVLVPVTVTDLKNHPVMNLKQEQFQLYEDGEQQQIQYFSQEDTPVSLGVILDLSSSMKNKMELAREAVQEFFGRANPKDDYFVVTFANRPQLLADTTQSLGTIEAKLSQAQPLGRTALLDAIYLGIQKAKHARYKRRALLIISDGGDNNSRYTSKEIRKLVQESDVQVYAVGVFDSVFHTAEEWYGKRLLTQVTSATGGRSAVIRNAAELPETASRISDEIRSQYVLGYRPSGGVAGGKYRKIRVLLNGAADAIAMPFQVYSKRGYQAPGE